MENVFFLINRKTQAVIETFLSDNIFISSHNQSFRASVLIAVEFIS